MLRIPFSPVARPLAPIPKKVEPRSTAAAVGFCPLQAMFSLGFLAFGKIAYHVICMCNAIDAIDKSG
jgi:hypothetical protein